MLPSVGLRKLLYDEVKESHQKVKQSWAKHPQYAEFCEVSRGAGKKLTQALVKETGARDWEEAKAVLLTCLSSVEDESCESSAEERHGLIQTDSVPL